MAFILECFIGTIFVLSEKINLQVEHQSPTMTLPRTCSSLQAQTQSTLTISDSYRQKVQELNTRLSWPCCEMPSMSFYTAPFICPKHHRGFEEYERNAFVGTPSPQLPQNCTLSMKLRIGAWLGNRDAVQWLDAPDRMPEQATVLHSTGRLSIRPASPPRSIASLKI